MEMDKCKPKSDISDLVDNYRDGTGALDMDVDSSNLDLKKESGRKVDLENNSKEAVKDGAKGIQFMILKANKIFTRKDILMADWF